MRRVLRYALPLVAAVASAATATDTLACGAYFARQYPASASTTTSASLFNNATKMVFARQGTTSTITMTADYRGDPKEFAVVIAVPAVLKREQIAVGDAKMIETIDRLTAPGLSETFDASPCPDKSVAEGASRSKSAPRTVGARPQVAPGAVAPGVTVEAEYAVGEYDVAVLSAEQSDGLRQWLTGNGYNVPEAATPVLSAYIKDGLKFFVAKVNLDRQQQKGYALLSPLQLTYDSPRFWVPLRLSTINAEAAQHMYVYALTPKGRVEADNMPTRTLSGDLTVPSVVKSDFDGFYRAVFDRLSRQGNRTAAIVEDVRSLSTGRAAGQNLLVAGKDVTPLLGAGWPQSAPVMLTRLHVKYDKSFKSDLSLKVAEDAKAETPRFTIRHAYTGAMICPQAAAYRQQVAARHRRDVANLARLTGWSRSTIAAKEKAVR